MRKRWLAVFAALPALYLSWLWTLPGVFTFEEAVQAHRRSDGIVLDRRGEVIHELRTDLEGRRLEWTSLAQVSPRLQEVLIVSEDRNFRTHGGVDWGAVASAAWDTLLHGRRRGASTLTMQLAAQLDESLQARQVHRSPLQKWRQMRAALALEQSWRKHEILEAYLNLVTFRGELQGIAAASRGLFGKQPHGLDLAEALILVALLRSPNADADAVSTRARRLAAAADFDVDGNRLDVLAGNALLRSYRISPQADLAPHVARTLLGRFEEGSRPAQVRTTLDAELQRAALAGLQEQLRRLKHQNVQDGAVLAVENDTGDVLTYVGNGGELSSAIYVDGAQAHRQAGSTLKPFLYALALERRLITPASPINDAPLNLPVNGGVYRPSNYDNVFRGLVSTRVALASSLNIPAVRLLQMVGEESFVSRLRELGFTQLRSADYYGPALALGTADITLWELVNAYRTLANRGNWSPLRLQFEAEGPPERQSSSHPVRRIYSEAAAFLVSDILSDRESRSSTFGLENVLSTSYWSAAKTGTSKDMRDNWCVGYSSEYTVGVWIGNFSGEPMYNVSGISGAAPLWLEIMDRLHRHRPSSPPGPPAGVTARPVAAVGESAPRTEWFQAGTEEVLPRAAPRETSARILYPPHEAVLAWDPDIPKDRQRVFFEASSDDGLRWRLDDRVIGPARLTPWAPAPGGHRLELIDRQGRHVDGVAFTVRGGPVEQEE